MKSRMQPRRFRIFDRLEQRFRRSRPGSVLILVVALLVLLALLGTAYINTAQTDRYSSLQNSFNTEIDLLLEGVENLTQASVINALFGPSFHQDTNVAPNEYAVSDYPLNKQSSFIADRYPSVQLPNAAVGAGNLPVWQFISALPTASNFESPYVNGATSPAGVYTTRKQLYPFYLAIPQGTITQNFPALFDGTHTYLAADADGDGIADSALFRLPIGQINGVTYYGGVRVVDNAAAINAAIAWQPNPIASTLPGNFFPTNINLNSLLLASDQGANFTTFNTTARFAGQATPGLIPVDDTGTNRLDFGFGTTSEAFWMQVGRRIANPGYIAPGIRYTALPMSEMQTMQARFVLHDPGVTVANTSSALEQYLSNSCLLGSPSTPYPASQTLLWAQNNFDFVTGGMPLRSMLVTQNGVSNFTYSKLRSAGAWNSATKYNFGDWVTFTDARSYVAMQQNTAQTPVTGVSTQYWEPQPWTTGLTKASANTATFGQLWAAYYAAMSDTPLTATSLGSVSPNALSAMFRSSLRSGSPPANWASPGNKPGFPQLQLRAAIAAINTLQLRNPASASGTAPPLAANISLTDVNGNPAFNVTVYGSVPQPYITEVYANTSGGPLLDYVAIELYNPYPFPITLTGWQLAFTPRAGPTLPTPTTLPSTNAWTMAPPTVPANGFLVLASSATLPAGITTPPSLTPTILPDLALALGSELVLLRPTALTMAPVDSYDFTGLPIIDPIAGGRDWHYIRPNSSAAVPSKAWHFVYPGSYAYSTTGPNQAGTKQQVPPATVSLASFGAPDATTAAGGYIDRPLQVDNTGFAGPNKALAATNNTFPYGGFARNADLLQVTYVGAYRITDTSNNLYELNSLPADSSMADDPKLVGDVQSEQIGRQSIGRFCPVSWADTLAPAAAPPYSSAYANELAAYQAGHPAVSPPAPVYVPDDYWTPDTTLQTGYQWTLRLFEYITVQSPQDDYLPDVDPAAGLYPAPAPPMPVANVNKTVANAALTNTPLSATEETVPVHGRININTANWRVLATIPFFDNPSINQAAANDLARAIIYYRDIDDGTTAPTFHPHGAFQSIYELNNVTVAAGSGPTTLAVGTRFRNAFGQFLGTFVVPGPHTTNVDGDLSNFTPNSASSDGVYGDFENQNLALNRISNLITTRSDSFTAYIIVQGWRNVGTNSPQLAVQRRAAFIIDRSAITPANVTQPGIINVSTQ